MISPRLQLFLSISNQTAYNEQLLFFLSHLPHTTRNFTTMRRFHFALLGILSVFLLSLLLPLLSPSERCGGSYPRTLCHRSDAPT